MAKEVRKFKVGEILIKEEIITQEQLDEALEMQKAEDLPLPLGEVCINMKFISRSDLRRLLRKYQSTIQLGELLVNMGLVDHEQLEAVVAGGAGNLRDGGLPESILYFGYIAGVVIPCAGEMGFGVEYGLV